MVEFLRENNSDIIPFPFEATYLILLDFSKLGLN
jgi:hypothetical protein